MPDGIKLEEAIQFAVELEKASVDVLDISVGNVVEEGFTSIPGPDKTPGTFVHLAEAVKAEVKVPVITVGRINSPSLAESILTEGKADLIAIGRQLIADPSWPEKVASDRSEEIRPCLSCNMCIDSAMSMGELICTVNPWFGREAEYKLTPAEVKKKVLVIGGGPAGMEATRWLAERGHQVTLCEKEGELGGQLILASIPPHKGEIEQLSKYLANRLEKLGVNISLGTEATEEWIDQVKPDVVILATGVNPFLPQIPGIERDNVVLSLDVLSGKADIGEKVAIIGGELVGCETADYLSDKGKQVTVMRRSDTMAAKMNTHARENLLGRLKRKGVGMLTGVQYEEITVEGIVITIDGGKQTIQADTIVIATGSNAELSLLETLNAKGITVHTIGDCTSPGRIADAMRDGAKVGGEI